MKRKLLLLSAALLFTSLSVMAQTANESSEGSESAVSHKVEMGETVMLIAKKYRVTPDDIYDMNPEAVHGISYNTVLQIPADKRYVKGAPKKSNRINSDLIYNDGHQTASAPKR
jgi:LysM repeat protein